MSDKPAVDEVRITATENVIGARVDGVDLRSPVEPATYDVLEEALERHGVLVIPAQEVLSQTKGLFFLAGAVGLGVLVIIYGLYSYGILFS